jgi:hypothetical protein
MCEQSNHAREVTSSRTNEPEMFGALPRVRRRKVGFAAAFFQA